MQPQPEIDPIVPVQKFERRRRGEVVDIDGHPSVGVGHVDRVAGDRRSEPLLESIGHDVATLQQVDETEPIDLRATDGSDLYNSDRERIMSTHYAGGFDAADGARVFDEHLGELPTEYLEMGETERNRVFNLGYFTWVEQQGIDIPDFEKRRGQDFWNGLRPLTAKWDGMIDDFNAATGASHG